MHGYFNDNLPSSFKLSLTEPIRTKSYKLARVSNKNPSAMFPKFCDAIEIDLKESAKIFKQRVINIHLENYERFKYGKPSCISSE